jgi:hypothetical protein
MLSILPFPSVFAFKEYLTCQKFHEHKEVKKKIISWLRVQAAEFCDIEYKNSYPGEAP